MRWADIPEPSARGRRCLVAWQQVRQQSQLVGPSAMNRLASARLT